MSETATVSAAIERNLLLNEEAEALIEMHFVATDATDAPIHRVMAIDFFSYFA